MLDWLIVGGGPHGTHLSLMLRLGGVPADRVRVIDPHPLPMARWWANVAAVGMRYLRSPSVHHIGAEPFELLDLGQRVDWSAPFAAPYHRPSVALFRQHAEDVVARHGLADLRLRTLARHAERVQGGWRVHTDEGAVEARELVLALGVGDQPRWPPEARALAGQGVLVHHVFEEGAPRPGEGPGPLLVVGGGISAAQRALAEAEAGQDVTMWSPHPLREHLFDSDPGWIGEKYLRAFRQEPCPTRRRALIAEARHAGSVTPRLASRLRAAVAEGRLRLLEGPMRALTAMPGGVGARLELAADRACARRVLLCTGFEARRPGGALVDGLVAEQGLRVAPCGYPVPDERLRWAPGLRVMGPLAELELGPTARNLIGARSAARRILAP